MKNLLVIFLLTVSCFCSATKPRPNSLGLEQQYTNPNSYLFAVPVEGRIVRDGSRNFTNIRFQPYNTMELYDESILFCGDITNFFEGKRGPMVITFGRVSHRMLQGISCHDIVSVYEVHDDQKTVQP